MWGVILPVAASVVLGIFFNISDLIYDNTDSPSNKASVSSRATMGELAPEKFLGDEHDCQYASDPRRNKDLGALLRDRHVLIVGAGRGIGRATAEFFAHTAAKSLSVCALELAEVQETARLCKEINGNLLTKAAGLDVRDYKQVEQFVREIDRDFGRIDVLFMNAGRPPQFLPTHESDPQAWWDTVAVSLQGAFNFSRAVIPIMRRENGGRIIFTASHGAHLNTGMSGYMVGKLGQVRLAETLHHENKGAGIKVFAISPGAVNTRFFTDFQDAVQGKIAAGSYVSSTLEGDKKSAEVAVQFLKDSTWDTPQMAAGLVVVLASGQLDFLSGRYVDSSVKIDDYISDKDKITKKDLLRVKLVVDTDRFVPRSRAED